MMPPSALVRSLAAPTFVRRLATTLVYLVFAGFAAAQDAPLKVAVYDVPPYGHVEPDGSIDGLSVDLWRRAAESLGREYHLVPVTQMEEILKGLERKDYHAAIGAITITPARLARVTSATRRIVRGLRLRCARTPGLCRRWPATGPFSGS